MDRQLGGQLDGQKVYFNIVVLIAKLYLWYIFYIKK